ncbi:MAG: hypothetical protein ABIQ47_10865 [Tepidiformaceae bacterium]
MNTNCRTCGTTLQSEISRDYGLCGACRHAWENLPDGGANEPKGHPAPGQPAPGKPRP